MKAHSPTPWEASICSEPTDDEPGEILIIDANEDTIGSLLAMEDDWEDAQIDARRMVACVNAAEGNSTEDLEAIMEDGSMVITVDDVIQDAVTAIATASDFRAQITEFLAAWDDKVNTTLPAPEWAKREERLQAAFDALREAIK